MGVTTLPVVTGRLISAGMDPQTPAAMIEQGTTSAQRHVVSTLSELPHAVTRSGLRPPALFVIGPSVARAQRLDWFNRLSLAGQRLVMAAAAESPARSLEEAGAEVVQLPSPVTPAARVVLGALPITGCVVRSAAEVDWLDEERGIASWPEAASAWCLGPEAAACARERGWQHVVELEADLTGAQLVRQVIEDVSREG
jgi:uroporphyrinogen III methyltransferase/synthase